MVGKVIHHERHSLCLGVDLLEQVTHAPNPLHSGVIVDHVHPTPVLQRPVEQQQVPDLVSLVLRVEAGWMVRGRRDRRAHFLRALLGNLVHTHQRPRRIEGAPVDLEHTLHLAHELDLELETIGLSRLVLFEDLDHREESSLSNAAEAAEGSAGARSQLLVSRRGDAGSADTSLRSLLDSRYP